MESNEQEQDNFKKADRKKTLRKKNIGLCNQELLKLVARGSAIICEILRLKDYIPEAYSNKNEEKAYKDLIFDFSIFKPDCYDKFDAKLKSDQELLDKDEDFRVNNIEIIERFFHYFILYINISLIGKLLLIKLIKEILFNILLILF